MPRVLPSIKTRSMSRPYFLNRPVSLAIHSGTEELGESDMYAASSFPSASVRREREE